MIEGATLFSLSMQQHDKQRNERYTAPGFGAKLRQSQAGLRKIWRWGEEGGTQPFRNQTGPMGVPSPPTIASRQRGRAGYFPIHFFWCKLEVSGQTFQTQSVAEKQKHFDGVGHPSAIVFASPPPRTIVALPAPPGQAATDGLFGEHSDRSRATVHHGGLERVHPITLAATSNTPTGSRGGATHSPGVGCFKRRKIKQADKPLWGYNERGTIKQISTTDVGLTKYNDAYKNSKNLCRLGWPETRPGGASWPASMTPTTPEGRKKKREIRFLHSDHSQDLEPRRVWVRIEK